MDQQKMNESEWDAFLNKTTRDGSNHMMKLGVSVEDRIFTEKFSHTTPVGLSFKNCIFEQTMSFFPSAIHSNMYITDCIFKKGLYMGAIVSERKITFLNCSIENEPAVFGDIKIGRLDLNLRFAKQIILSDDANIDYVQIGGKDRNKYNKLSLNLAAVNRRMEINHTEIEELYFGRSTLTGELSVVNTYIKIMALENFRNDGSVKFLNCKAIRKEGSSLLINQSNLGKAEFFKFDFSSFDRVNITNSVIFENVFINCVWSKTNLVSEVVHFSDALNQPDEVEKPVLAENRKDVFKQIKASYSKQGDYVQEQFFHALEMNQYYRSLSFRTNFWTKVILRLSYWTSDYGQSFSRPIASIFLVDIVLFWCMFILRSTAYNSYDLTHVSNYINTIASVLNFMNPLHKTDNLLGAPFIVDTAARIFSSYMIYNMIRATRRFVK